MGLELAGGPRSTTSVYGRGIRGAAAPARALRRRAMSPTLKRHLPAALLATYLLSFLVAAQIANEAPLDHDGYFHARLAQLYPSRGFSRSFPWTQASTWRDRFCDKEVLFHALMIPFARDRVDPIRGVRWFAVALSASVIIVLFVILHAHRARPPLVFAVLPACMGGIFLARLTMIRSHVLSMALILIGAHLLLSRRWRWLLVLGFVYAWSYTVPLVLVLTAAPFVLGRWLRGGGFDWRSLIAAGAGVALGLIIHPYSPHTLETFLTYVEVVRDGLLGADRARFELGGEVYRLSPRDLLTYYPFFLAASAVLLGAAAKGWRRITPEAAGATVAALCWIGASLVLARFVEYAIPLLALALGLVLRDLSPARSETPKRGCSSGTNRASDNRRGRAAVVAASLALLAGHLLSVYHYVGFARRAPEPRFRTASAWLERHLAPGTTVLNLYWDDFPELFYYATTLNYVWGLDPTYTARFDRSLAGWLEDVRTRRHPLDGGEIRKRLGAHYLVMRRARVPRYRELLDRTHELVHADRHAAVYALGRR
jgi:hypothetical protein